MNFKQKTTLAVIFLSLTSVSFASINACPSPEKINEELTNTPIPVIHLPDVTLTSNTQLTHTDPTAIPFVFNHATITKSHPGLTSCVYSWTHKGGGFVLQNQSAGPFVPTPGTENLWTNEDQSFCTVSSSACKFMPANQN